MMLNPDNYMHRYSRTVIF